MGDGLAPFRVVDTYHMFFIMHYHRKSWRLRKQRALPALPDHNDLPTTTEKEADLEAFKVRNGEISVLTPEQQRKFEHHQAKFSKSHSYYKPHETHTHYAFPLKMLIAITLLLDAHSLLQISLGTCTWAIDYHHRSAALTTTILCFSITVNILAGVLISIGDKRTRKKDVALKMKRQELTGQAIRKVEKHKEVQEGHEMTEYNHTRHSTDRHYSRSRHSMDDAIRNNRYSVVAREGGGAHAATTVTTTTTSTAHGTTTTTDFS